MTPTRRIVALGVGIAVLAGAGSAWYLLASRAADTVSAHALRPDDADVVRMGARIYAQNCAACHGVQREGQPNWRERGADDLLPAPPHDASGHTWHHADAQLFAITKHGIAQVIGQPDYGSSMPVYDGVLSDDEIVAVLSWIKSQWPPEVRQYQDKINAQYRKSLSR